MSVYRPSYRDRDGKKKISQIWWFNFRFAGRAIQESSKSTRKTVAQQAEKNRRLELEKGFAGMPLEKREDRIASVNAMVTTYLQRYELDHRERPNSIIFSKGRLAHIKRLLGTMRMPDLTEDCLRKYIGTRLEEEACGRTINAEIGEFSRAIGKEWKILWPKLPKQEERSDVGQALSPEEEKRLIDTAVSNPRWKMGATIIRGLLLTGMRIGEFTGLSWARVNFDQRIVTVGRSKTPAGTDRQIPMNDDLFNLLTEHAAWFEGKFGKPQPEHYLFPFGTPSPSDPLRPITTMKTVWGTIREEAKVDCRIHDLRHTVATKLAEAGTPETTMLALMGHMSRKMLERYSHIRMAAKRTAVESLAAPKAEIPKSDGITKESTKVRKLSLVKRSVNR